MTHFVVAYALHMTYNFCQCFVYALHMHKTQRGQKLSRVTKLNSKFWPRWTFWPCRVFPWPRRPVSPVNPNGSGHGKQGEELGIGTRPGTRCNKRAFPWHNVFHDLCISASLWRPVLHAVHKNFRCLEPFSHCISNLQHRRSNSFSWSSICGHKEPKTIGSPFLGGRGKLTLLAPLEILLTTSFAVILSNTRLLQAVFWYAFPRHVARKAESQ